MVIKIKLTEKQAEAALRDIGNQTTGPFIAKGCKCLGCGVLRAVLTAIKRQQRKS